MSKSVHKPAEYDGIGHGGGDRRRQPEPGFEKASPRPIFLGLILFWLAVGATVYHFCGCP
jgi:hypothetical protein